MYYCILCCVFFSRVAQDCWHTFEITQAAMGSSPKFTRAICESCQNSSFINTTFIDDFPVILCPECANKVRTTWMVDSMPFLMMHRYLPMPRNVLVVMSEFFIQKLDSKAIFTRDYLQIMLLGHPMRFGMLSFRNLCYYHNGIAGSISATEDIIDRIIDYVVGHRR